MADESGDKTESATPRRRQESREEGNVVRSADLNAAVLLMGAVLLLGAFASQMFSGMESLVGSMLERSGKSTTLDYKELAQLMSISANYGARLAAPVVLGLTLLALLAGMIQSGFLFTMQPLTPKFSRVSPLRGLSQLFSFRGTARMLMSVVKVGVVLAVAFPIIKYDIPQMLMLIQLDVGPLLVAMCWLVWSLAIKVAGVLLVLGILDYAYQKWQFERDLKMSKQEIREEFKRMEGDPLIKQRRAKVAKQLLLQRIQQDVPKADVIVTNPTHFAIALRYDNNAMAAPKVIAKGADFLALRIRQIAVANGVPIVERPPLARALYQAVEVGQEVPPQHYAAVAEILAYVYRLSGRKSA